MIDARINLYLDLPCCIHCGSSLIYKKSQFHRNDCHATTRMLLVFPCSYFLKENSTIGKERGHELN